jgi:hypothetical protein
VTRGSPADPRLATQNERVRLRELTGSGMQCSAVRSTRYTRDRLAAATAVHRVAMHVHRLCPCPSLCPSLANYRLSGYESIRRTPQGARRCSRSAGCSVCRAPTRWLLHRDPRWRVGLLASECRSSECAFVRRTSGQKGQGRKDTQGRKGRKDTHRNAIFPRTADQSTSLTRLW